jgi:hypothetical protein
LPVGPGRATVTDHPASGRAPLVAERGRAGPAAGCRGSRSRRERRRERAKEGGMRRASRCQKLQAASGKRKRPSAIRRRRRAVAAGSGSAGRARTGGRGEHRIGGASVAATAGERGGGGRRAVRWWLGAVTERARGGRGERRRSTAVELLPSAGASPKGGGRGRLSRTSPPRAVMTDPPLAARPAGSGCGAGLSGGRGRQPLARRGPARWRAGPRARHDG